MADSIPPKISAWIIGLLLVLNEARAGCQNCERKWPMDGKYHIDPEDGERANCSNGKYWGNAIATADKLDPDA